MAIAETMEAPRWIDSGAVMTGGLDLLGLRLPVQVVGGKLLDGITTVTPQVRYFSFRAWLIQQYGQTGMPDSWQRFTEFALRIESALVLGNVVHSRGATGLIGADEAIRRLDANTSSVSVAPLVKSPAATIYTGPSDQLGITRTREDAVPALVIERGEPLARQVGQRFSTIPLLKRLIDHPELSEIAVDDLAELGAVARIDQIPEDERATLLASIVPGQPRPRERARVATYMALLALAERLKTYPDEYELFEAASSKQRFGEPLLDDAADGWVTYCVRDVIAVTQESVLSEVMNEINAGPDNGLSGRDAAEIVSSLMERVEEHSAPLRDLELLSPSESISDLSFRQLRHRIERLASADVEYRHGLARWDAALSETRVYKLSWSSGAGALSLALVAWILAALRVGHAVREGGESSGNVSYQGWRRLGLRDVILTELERFEREDRPVRDVVADMAYRTVAQHLQIAWSRLQVDLNRDVALLTTEGGKWCGRGKYFGGGRTASRLVQAAGWLEQLRLIDDEGITSDGKLVLHDGLRALATGRTT